MRIIDKDIDQWTACIETHEALLRRCLPCDEVYHRALLVCARSVLDTLKVYRATVGVAESENIELSLEP